MEKGIKESYKRCQLENNEKYLTYKAKVWKGNTLVVWISGKKFLQEAILNKDISGQCGRFLYELFVKEAYGDTTKTMQVLTHPDGCYEQQMMSSC